MEGNTVTDYPVPATERLFTAAQVADILGCHVRTVQRMADSGALTRIHIGPRLVRYSSSELARLTSGNDEAAASTPRLRPSSAMARRHEPE